MSVGILTFALPKPEIEEVSCMYVCMHACMYVCMYVHNKPTNSNNFNNRNSPDNKKKTKKNKQASQYVCMSTDVYVYV